MRTCLRACLCMCVICICVCVWVGVKQALAEEKIDDNYRVYINKYIYQPFVHGNWHLRARACECSSACINTCVGVYVHAHRCVCVCV